MWSVTRFSGSAAEQLGVHGGVFGYWVTFAFHSRTLIQFPPERHTRGSHEPPELNATLRVTSTPPAGPFDFATKLPLPLPELPLHETAEQKQWTDTWTFECRYRGNER